MVLSKNEVLNLTSYYVKEYDLDKSKHLITLKKSLICMVINHFTFSDTYLLLKTS